MKGWIHIIGAGLSGSEAALSAARMGARVRLYEMRPKRMTPAHLTDGLAELVCSNSLGGEAKTNAKGLLQAEMRVADSVIMRAAEATRLAAGGALAVDRSAFSRYVTRQVAIHPDIELVREEIFELPEDGVSVLASGPLTSEALSRELTKYTGERFLSFYDAAAPIVLGESIDREICYLAGRYGQSADYLNCPMDEVAYERLYQALSEARGHTPHNFEQLEFFEGCIPVEEIARRGRRTLLFGPLKPVGLPDPRNGRTPFAVLQLRREDPLGRMWSLVGFQTGLKWGEQKELLRLIPGLENAEVVRYGVMHRNTYLNAPKLLEPTMAFKRHPGLFAAGVLAGTEGYLESAATGWLVGLNAVLALRGRPGVVPPETSMLGGLVRFLVSANPEGFQPMNANWGLVPSPVSRMKRTERREHMFQTGLTAFSDWHSRVM